MKPTLKSIGAASFIVASLGLGTITAPAAGLLSDSGFESGTPVPSGIGGWGIFNGAAFSQVVAHNGLWSMADFTPSGNVPGSFQFLAATPGSQWDLTGFGLTTGLPPQSAGPVFGLIQLTFFSGPNGTGTDLGTVETSPGNAKGSGQITAASPINTWIPLDTGIATAPAGAQSIGAYSIFVNFTSLTTAPLGAYFDDLTLTQVPEPSSLAILGLGLVVAGCGLRRQRA
jgi:hypothetical protein